MSTVRVYYTHYNGLNPYEVHISKQKIVIYDTENPSVMVRTILNPKRVFIGKSPKIPMTKYSGGYGSQFNGNSILINTHSYNYIWIGDEIQEFTTKNDNITKFYSPVGNNDVPYPIAIGENYVYCFIYPKGYINKEYVYIKSNLQKTLDYCMVYDPFFYSFNHKPPKMTLEEFKKIQDTPLNKISYKKVKQLARLFGVETSGTKKQLVSRIESLRGIKIYKEQ